MSKRFKLSKFKGKLPNLNSPNVGIIIATGDESENMKMEKALLEKYPNLMIPKKGTMH